MINFIYKLQQQSINTDTDSINFVVLLVFRRFRIKKNKPPPSAVDPLSRPLLMFVPEKKGKIQGLDWSEKNLKEDEDGGNKHCACYFSKTTDIIMFIILLLQPNELIL